MLFTKTTSHGEYRAPNTVILTRAVNLTARALQKEKVSIGQITIQQDCTISVDFVIDTHAAQDREQGVPNGSSNSAAQSKLVRLGIPLTGQRIVCDDLNSNDEPGPVRVRTHFYVQPQECWESIADYFIKIRVDHKRLCIDVETDRLKEGDNLSLMPFINYTGEYQTAEVFLQNLYRRLAWHTHWILKGSPYQVVPTDKNGKLSRVTFQPAKYQFGTIPAPSCNIGDLGDLLFTHALRPVMFTC
jgi:hypothetical protein